MARLPISGSDTGVWGNILNDFLSQSLASDGLLKAGIVTNDSIAATAAIAQTKIANLTTDLSGKLAIANNLSDVANAATARTNLGVAQASGFAKITVGASAPTSPAVGDVWIDTN